MFSIQIPDWNMNCKYHNLYFACSLLPTLLIEGILLFLFGYRSRKSRYSFLLVNLA